MEESRAEKLHEILKKLGEALHRSLVSSEEVQACLQELHDSGWDAIMMLEASVVCQEDGTISTDRAALHIHAAPPEHGTAEEITPDDVRMLRSLGILANVDRSMHRAPRSDDPTDR